MRTAFLTAMVITALIFVWKGGTRAEGSSDADPYADTEHVQAGKKLYLSTGCVACHGGNARGAVGPDLTDDEWLRPFSIQMVHDTIANGRSGTLMSLSKGDLTDEQIWSLVSYILDEGRKRKAAGGGSSAAARS